MNDKTIRAGLAAIAGLSYLGGAIPSDMPIANITDLSLQVWIYFIINILTGIFSPSLLRSAGKLTGLMK